MNKLALALFAAALAVALCGCSSHASTSSAPSADSTSASSASAESSDGRTSATADTVFGFPEQFDVKSGSGESIGTVAVFRAASSDCSVENLELWCNQYLRWGLDNWAVIEFTDRPGYGVYGNGPIVEVGVALNADYSLADDSDAAFYVFDADDVAVDGHLSEVDG